MLRRDSGIGEMENNAKERDGCVGQVNSSVGDVKNSIEEGETGKLAVVLRW